MPFHTLAGIGLALTIFFCGIVLLKSSLSVFAPRLGPLLRSALKNPLLGVAAGFLATALVQSSSATNAVAVGFVAAGILRLPHAFSIVLGSNIGTTITPQVAAFGTFDAGLVLLTLGLLGQTAAKPGVRAMGGALGGVGGMFLGLWALGQALGGFSHTELGSQWLDRLVAHDWVAVLFGASFTAVVQSSSAVSTLLVGMADGGLVPVRTAVIAVLGSNIGTVTTTILASLSGGAAARRTALADLIFNVLGVVCVWPFLGLMLAWTAGLSAEAGRQVAHAHTLFNLLTVAAMLPFVYPFCRLVDKISLQRKG